ncbi:hypothetical protein ACHAWU_005174 [Discostella pseudostelligera]|uniref:Uncharacterized protein n=1 Tax=Discostella pseudostelligera TaxID=259834 RepID=A0ABD3NEP0_9STRA
MNYPVLAFATVAAMTAIASGNEFLCDIPTAGCANGMFNQVTCSCDCIPPFCPDALAKDDIASAVSATAPVASLSALSVLVEAGASTSVVEGGTSSGDSAASAMV